MIGPSTLELEKFLNRSQQERVDSLQRELLSGDSHRQRAAAAAIRASYDIRDQYRRAGLKLVIMVDGDIQHVDPDSPLLLDLSSLISLVKHVCPLSPELEPPGFE